MTRQRHLRRTAVLATACAVFAATATGSAVAWNGSVRQVSSPATTARVADAPVPAAASKAPSARIGATSVTATPAAKTAVKDSRVRTRATVSVNPAKASTATARKQVAKRATAQTVTVPASVTISRYVDSPGSQSAIDKCKLVLWTHSPLWLAGHNWCGYQWMAFVATGTVVHVTSGAAAGTYVVTGHKRLSRQSGSLPHVAADLVLQTCIGSGTGLTLLRRA